MEVTTWFAILGPLTGVALGGWLARGNSRAEWLRDRSIGEVQVRREQYAAFQKALWAYASRVLLARNLYKAKTQEHPKIRYDFEVTRLRFETCRDAFADLTMFANADAQNAGRAAMEALSRSYEALRVENLPQSDASFAEYEAAFTDFAGAVNRDTAVINAMLYAFLTPVWRAFFRKTIRRQPLPFETFPAPVEPVLGVTQGDDEEGLTS